MCNKDVIFTQILKTFRKSLTHSSLQVSLTLQSPSCSFSKKNCTFAFMIKGDVIKVLQLETTRKLLEPWEFYTDVKFKSIHDLKNMLEC